MQTLINEFRSQEHQRVISIVCLLFQKGDGSDASGTFYTIEDHTYESLPQIRHGAGKVSHHTEAMNMYEFIKIGHIILIQCHINHMEMKKIQLYA